MRYFQHLVLIHKRAGHEPPFLVALLLTDHTAAEMRVTPVWCFHTSIRRLHYVQFRKEREYGKMLQDDARLLSLLREGVDENDIFLKATDELLILREGGIGFATLVQS